MTTRDSVIQPSAPDTSKASCRLLASLLEAHGVRNVIVSPGSRNAPVALALDAREKLRKFVITDERAAAYAAVGMAETTGEAVAVVCTSGTALLNYAPAVAEAYYQGLPLIIISADRPAQWIDQDDSQTIRQASALDNIVKKSYDIPDFQEDNKEMSWFANRELNDALLTALSTRPGPVHINMQLSAPLDSTISRKAEEHRVIELFNADNKLSKAHLHALCNEARDKKILVISGFMQPSAAMSKAIGRLAALPQVAVLAETISNVHARGAILNIDRVLSQATPEELELFKPDLVISTGGALISRMVKDLLRKSPPPMHWAVGNSHTTIDPFMALTARINVEPAHFLSHLAGALSRDCPPSRYRSQWQQLNALSLEELKRFTTEAPWSDFKALSLLFSLIPEKYNLHCSNGTAIRYAQLFAQSPYHASFCNRGVSGIDGCTSTAVGSAITYSGKSLLITGDMSFHYDSGILNSPLFPPRLKIVVLNNGGGEIFRFVKSTRSLPVREEYLCSAPRNNIQEMAAAFGFRHLKASSPQQLTEAARKLFASEEKTILEIITPPGVNASVLTSFLNRKNVYF